MESAFLGGLCTLRPCRKTRSCCARTLFRLALSHDHIAGGAEQCAPPESLKRQKRVGLPKGVGHTAPSFSPSLVEPSAPTTFPPTQGNITVLGIETSCDDTAAAVVCSDGRILSEAVRSQAEVHEKFGGVVPNLAMEAHKAAVGEVVDEALLRSGLSLTQVDAVAVTMGPGLEICLRVGFCEAKRLCTEGLEKCRTLPHFVAVNHLEAHCLLARLFDERLEFPFLTLLISGGHCQLLVARGVGRYDMVGGTLDDALGEAFDKTARLLGLSTGGGGGPAVEKLAKRGNPRAYSFPVPMRQRRDCNFSYAGLKNAVRLAAGDAEREQFPDIAASFQHAALSHMEDRLRRAIKWCQREYKESIQTLVVCGGVAANAELRQRIDSIIDECKWRVVIPPPRLCTDNGVMVAWSGIERIREGLHDNPEKVDVVARWPLSTSMAYHD